MRSVTSLALFFSLLTACAIETPGVGSTESSVVIDDMCSTIDYGPRPPANELFDFLTTEQADAYMLQFAATPILAAISGADARYTGISSDPHILGLVAEVFRGMKLVFPVETADLDHPPPVAIIETPKRNAFALPPGYVGTSTKAPWLFAVHTGILNVPEDQLVGVIAHEMAHLILRNYDQNVRNVIVSSYLLPSLDEHGIFGAEQPNDVAVQQHILEMLKREFRIGFVPEQGLSAVLGDDRNQLQMQLDREPACTDAKASFAALQAAQLPFQPVKFSVVGAHRPVPTDVELADLRRAADATVASLQQCFAASTDTSTIANDYITMWGVPAADVTQYMHPAEVEADADPTLTTHGQRFLYGESHIRAETVALRADPAFPLAQLRSYDTEQDSDDAAVRVLIALGRNPEANAGFLIDSLTPEAHADCLAAIAAGQPIEFGDFRDPHPNHCWRYFHGVDLAKTLRECPTNPGRRAASANRSGGSVAPIDPIDLIRGPQ